LRLDAGANLERTQLTKITVRCTRCLPSTAPAKLILRCFRELF
jgi:hypothetical protein